MRKPISDVVWETRTRIWAFALIGAAAGALGAWAYYERSESPDRLFHSIILLLAGGVSFPFLATIAHVSLKGYYTSMENQAVVVEALQAHRHDAEQVLGQVKSIVATVEREVGNGKLAEVLASLGAIPAKLDSIQKSVVKALMKGK